MFLFSHTVLSSPREFTSACVAYTFDPLHEVQRTQKLRPSLTRIQIEPSKTLSFEPGVGQNMIALQALCSARMVD